MPRSWPVAAKIAAIAEAGVNATDCMPEATDPCVPGPRERVEILGRRPEHAPQLLVGEERLGENGLAVARLEVLGRRLLVAAHVRLEQRALGLHRRALHDVAHVQRVAVAGHHVGAAGVAGRPAPEHVAHRADDVRLDLAQLGPARQRRIVRRLEPRSQRGHLRLDPARERDRLGSSPRTRSTTRASSGRRARASGRTPAASEPRVSEAVRPPSV